MLYVHYKYWNDMCEATQWKESSILLSEEYTISSIIDLLIGCHTPKDRYAEPAEVIILNIIWDKKEIKV